MSFDPDNFLNQDVTGANDTRIIPVPEGEYPALAKKIDFRQSVKEDKTTNMLDILWEIDDERVKEVTGMPSSIVRQTIFLDIDDGGALSMAKGKNVQLGKLREALNLNDPSRPFNFRMLENTAGKVTVKHELYKEEMYAQVKGVTSL